VAVHRQQRGIGAGREAGADRLDEWSHKKQLILQRDVLTPRNEMHLAIHASCRAVGANEERGVERSAWNPGRALHLPLDLIAAEKYWHAGRARERSNLAGADQILFKPEGRGRLGPDDELRAPVHGLFRHGQVALQDRSAARRAPLLPLIDVALHQPDAERTALACEFAALDARVAQTAASSTPASTSAAGRYARATATATSAALTLATSADTPKMPATLANCAIGSVVAWL